MRVRGARFPSLAAFAGLACAGLAAWQHDGAARADEVPLVFNAPVLTTLPEPFFPTMFRARDLDGDGKPDLALAGRIKQTQLHRLGMGCC
jgi:hypothetical protein